MKALRDNEINNEMLVLGSILSNSEKALIGLKLVSVEDFSEERHKVIFKAIQRVYQEKNTVDVLLIGTQLKIDGNLDSAGGLAYLLTLELYAGTSSHIEAYCEDLKKLSVIKNIWIILQNGRILLIFHHGSSYLMLLYSLIFLSFLSNLLNIYSVI